MNSSLVWFRRDLRLDDHAPLHHALSTGGAVHCAFVFDTTILDRLDGPADRRVAFIHARVAELDADLRALGGGLHVLHGDPRHLIPSLAGRLGVAAVHAGRDHEPDARDRDAAVAEALASRGMTLRLHKDQVIFDTDEVLTGNGRPYRVFTPYKRAWLARLSDQDLAEWPTDDLRHRLAPLKKGMIPTLADLGFQAIDPGIAPAGLLLRAFLERIDRYHQDRDYPARGATSGLSPHLRFGTVSIRSLARLARERGGEGAEAWLTELIWREFYQMLIWHVPESVERAYQDRFADLAWPDPPGHFEAWLEGRTGYPIIDAAMRELDRTGRMHNRLRMLTASFLVKDLEVDWRRGERWFAARLLDYDQAANVGGWQWCASTGTDAQPWFRIFNPVSQSARFDPGGIYIRRWLPELAMVPDKYIHAPWTMSAATQAASGVVIGRDYPAPLVDHAQARAATLARYQGHP